ncbi:MAG: hypothetical protein V1774_05495 [Candidatus Eisenbacteria bacterium]
MSASDYFLAFFLVVFLATFFLATFFFAGFAQAIVLSSSCLRYRVTYAGPPVFFQ